MTTLLRLHYLERWFQKLSASLPATEMENTKSIELKYQFMLEYPLSVPEYEIERKKFFSMK